MNTALPGGIDVFGASDVGRVRDNNEDHFIIAGIRKAIDLRQTNVEDRSVFTALRGAEAQLLVVADGVGGNAGGEIASGTAVSASLEYVAKAAGCFTNFSTDAEHDFLAELEKAVHTAHDRVRALATDRTPPATTLTMMTFVWPRGYLVHVGDSRAMYLHDGRLRTLTRDQTMAEAMVDAGALTEEQAARSSLSNRLYSALGGEEMTPSVGLVDFVRGDVLLLCSDGLTKHVNDARIAEVLGAGGSAEAMTKALIADALAGGGTDNVTVIVARMVG
ncbi:MAG: protein phosphatase 2C domain-containing protein [Gemmatimonadetes bacterium]|nr:protein phosphatase 2C domain-containing protein [Gemmatimonadota bacterium]